MTGQIFRHMIKAFWPCKEDLNMFFFCVCVAVSITCCCLNTHAGQMVQSDKNKDNASIMISKPFGNRFQHPDVFDIVPPFFLTAGFFLCLFFVAADTSAESRWIQERRSRWRTFATWWWPTTRIGLCRTPSHSREPRNCSTPSHCQRCCQSMNSSPSCMTNIQSTYDTSTESTGGTACNLLVFRMNVTMKSCLCQSYSHMETSMVKLSKLYSLHLPDL